MPDRLGLNPAQWERAVDLFERAAELPPAARDPFVLAESKGDDLLAGLVRDMLEADVTDAGLLDEGLAGIARLAPQGRDDPLRPGQILGTFEIIAELGRGGMGVVYSARDRTLGRIAALKLLPHVDADSADAERLIAEAQAASALDHPNVATIYQVGEHDGRRFIAMARYEGETLRDRLARGPIARAEALEIARQIASGLAAAHAAGLVHRDVKPANIFLTRQGLAKLLDFGIATLSRDHDGHLTTRGTVRYMSPEQARGEPVDGRSDLWSLGVTLFEMMTGRPPFPGRAPAELLESIAQSSPATLSRAVRGPVGALVERALTVDIDARYQTASEFIAAIQRAQKATDPAHRTRRLVGAAVGVGSLFAAYALWNNVPRAANSQTPVIAVLGAVDSQRPDAALATGLTQEIASRLIALGRVRVVRSPDAAAPARHVYRFTLATSDEPGPRVEFRLVRTSDSTVVWRSHRALDARELPEVSRSTVINILQAVGTPATERERSQIGAGFPANADAYQEFLLGNQLLAQRTPVTVEAALAHYRRATTLDSTYAAAFARQSYAYSVLLDWGWRFSSPVDPLAEGLSLADHALALDSSAAEPWLARAYLLVHRDTHRFSGTVEALQHAITLDPYNAEAFHQYGQTLMALGRFQEALAAYRRVLDLEPERAMTLVPIAGILKRQGQLEEGLRHLDSAIAVRPGIAYPLAIRSFHKSYTGDISGARMDAESALALDSVFPVPALAALAKALWLSGDTAGARQRIADAERAVARPGTPSPTESFVIAIAHVAMGRLDRAESILRSASPRGAWLWFYYTQPEFESFRNLPGPRSVLSEADPRTSG